MALYLIGDIQGCDDALAQLLHHVDFSPSRDTLYVLGDLVNRGPDSVAVVRRLMAYGSSAHCLLGNHDLHLLAVAHGCRPPKRKDTLTPLLEDPGRDAMVHWLRHQGLAHREVIGTRTVLMVHAGVLPQWSANQAVSLAREVEAVLQSNAARDFFATMYGDAPSRWHDDLKGHDRIRVIVNALTRLRFCDAQGTMEFSAKGPAASAPDGCMPWFDVPGRQTARDIVAFGHWSTLGWLGREDVYALDQGCVWGGQLAALRVSDRQHWSPELITVDCPQMQAPGT
ncbi:symmetrical bis(5'-nucleosyl)-tetraphosphatase [Curvibacter sp. APW13]|uniref:symmetrical bis(5'-nucleosyl)-tetraphosphatase n=1 Tax=Curvibacter sp. APW13 TaxID=3077236 RepID=UPI0028DE6400|nr:symmetrical bis(5'-nucleosyl)-tetraphosphatase [Curvibacter sp. APW13]MDT8991119.1 symmetrical bis(5'-nucleosyl)-tetraphosphatase [Curvibacter sp. APW13]